MIPEPFELLTPEAQALHQRACNQPIIRLTAQDLAQAEELVDAGWGTCGHLVQNSRFWPVRVHPDHVCLKSGSNWVGSSYAELSACEAECSCAALVPSHCGVRLATLHGASIDLADGRCRVSLRTENHCRPTTFRPSLATFVLDSPRIGQLMGHFVRIFGVLAGARAWRDEDIVREAHVCTATPVEDCWMGSVTPHIMVPDHAPSYEAFAGLIGQPVSVTSTSIAIVDDQGRWPLDRGLDGQLPTTWDGPSLQ